LIIESKCSLYYKKVHFNLFDKIVNKKRNNKNIFHAKALKLFPFYVKVIVGEKKKDLTRGKKSFNF
jgi:hypothetical protein